MKWLLSFLQYDMLIDNLIYKLKINSKVMTVDYRPYNAFERVKVIWCFTQAIIQPIHKKQNRNEKSIPILKVVRLKGLEPSRRGH